MKTAIIVGRFQAPTLHEGYQKLLAEGFDTSKYDNVLIIVCNAYRIPSKTDPLNYQQRLHILHDYIKTVHVKANFQIAPLNDNPSDEVWSNNLDCIIESHGFKLKDCVFLHSRDSFHTYYSGNVENCVEVEAVRSISSTDVRGQRKYFTVRDTNEDFARGVTYATQQGYPSIVPTVDVAVLLKTSEGVKIILGKKSNKETYCLPGGFVDTTDASIHYAGSREVLEETNVVVSSDNLEYVDSMFIKDWRFKGDDRILTTLFITILDESKPDYPFRMKNFKAGDDLETVTVLPLSLFGDEKTHIELISKNHQELIKKVVRYAKRSELIPEGISEENGSKVG